VTFCPGLALNLDSPNLYLHRSWDYRCEPLHLSHATNPFRSGYFGDGGGSQEMFAWAGLKAQSS
jgi:hypothetical protein